jgi:hypothetical protein
VSTDITLAGENQIGGSQFEKISPILIDVCQLFLEN